jgi:hypothetical protein
VDKPDNKSKRAGFNSPGMRRVRLMFWHLFRKTPLRRRIDEAAERLAAEHCGMSWEEYQTIKREQWALWWRSAAKRERARRTGRWPNQPLQLRRHRKVTAPGRARLTKDKPRFSEWAFRELERCQRCEDTGRKERILNRVLKNYVPLFNAMRIDSRPRKPQTNARAEVAVPF